MHPTRTQPRTPQASRTGRVGRIDLRDPERRNALDVAALSALRDAIAALGADPACDAIVLAGEGSAFCAGFDLASCVDEPRRVEDLLALLSQSIASLRSVDVPVVARVQGAALAGGCALLTACDFVVVARDAQLGYPVHRIGISPAVSAVSLMSRMGGNARALMMSNDLVDGTTAHAIGLATHCVEPEALDGEVDALVARLLAKGPVAMRATKRWIRSIEEQMPGDLGSTAARDQDAIARTRDASMALASGDEFATMLRGFWSARARRAAPDQGHRE